jgi:hypothetical protein
MPVRNGRALGREEADDVGDFLRQRDAAERQLSTTFFYVGVDVRHR